MYIILDKRGTMELPIQTRSEKAADAALAIVLEGVSAKWQMNVLHVRGCPTIVKVRVDGKAIVEAPPRSRSRQTKRATSQRRLRKSSGLKM